MSPTPMLRCCVRLLPRQGFYALEKVKKLLCNIFFAISPLFLAGVGSLFARFSSQIDVRKQKQKPLCVIFTSFLCRKTVKKVDFSKFAIIPPLFLTRYFFFLAFFGFGFWNSVVENGAERGPTEAPTREHAASGRGGHPPPEETRSTTPARTVRAQAPLLSHAECRVREDSGL